MPSYKWKPKSQVEDEAEDIEDELDIINQLTTISYATRVNILSYQHLLVESLS